MAKPKSRKEELINELLNEPGLDPQAILGKDGLLEQLTKSIVERALQGEMNHHLGYEKHSPDGNGTGNSRNGSSEKTLKTPRGKVKVKVPRDRKGDFRLRCRPSMACAIRRPPAARPQIVGKHQTRWDELDDSIISMYACGMTTP